MRLRRLLWIATLPMVLAIGSGLAAEGDVDRALAELFPRLGAEKWKDRQAARKNILAMGELHPEEVFREGVDTLVRSKDPEVIHLTKSLLKELVIKHLFLKKQAFLGIRMRNAQLPTVFKGQQFIPVDVTEVLPNTAASAGGMKLGDRILKMDKHICSHDFASHQIIAYITSQNPGYTLELLLLSGGKVVKKKITLGTRPALPGDIPIETRKKRFFENWLSEQWPKAQQRVKEATE